MTQESLTSYCFIALGVLALAGCASEVPSTGTDEPAVTAPPAAQAKSNPTGSGETATKKIDNATGGTVALPNGTTLDVPPGALPPGVDTITITSSPVAAPAEYVAASPTFIFEPDGTIFLKPLKISIPVTLTADAKVADLTMLWSRAHSDGFDMLPTSFTPVVGKSSDFIASGEVTHFSRGFCGAKYATDPHPARDAYDNKN